MRPLLLIATLALVASTLLVPGSSAHAAPAPATHETRLLHDHNDDSFVVLLGKHGFDAIALDAREAYDLDADEPTLVLKLILNGGCSDTGQTSCEDLRHVISFNAGGTTQSVAFVTNDGGTTWTGDMDRYGSPVDLNDGTRFAIEGEIRFSALGISSGDGLSDWYVEGFADGEAADNMPAGFDNQRSDLDVTGPIATVYDIGTYTVRAPDYYVSLETDTRDVMGDTTRNATITNLLDQPASIQLTAQGPDGITVDFGDAERIDLDAGASRDISYEIAGHGDGDLRILAHTSLGGLAEATMAVAADHAGPERITSPDLEAGGVFERTFDRIGVFSYHDHKNPLVEGTVTIVEGNASMQTHEVRYVAGGEHGTSFDPAELIIQVGDTVRWINDVEALAVMGTLDDAPTEHDHSNHDHSHEEPEVEDAPATPLALLVVGLVALTLRRRSL